MSDHSSNPPTDVKHRKPKAEGSIKETLISLVISLAMALIFKLYLIEAYRIIRKNMAKYSRGFGAHHTGKNANYDESLAVEMYELLSHAVECADASNQMQHAIGIGVSNEVRNADADAVFV